MRRLLTVALISAVLLFASVSSAAATDAMKPGRGLGDQMHAHYGAPGRMP